MATKNRGVIVATAQTVVDAVETELDQISDTVIEQVGLVDRMGERQASALDMTWLRKYRMWREWVGERETRSDRRAFQSRMYSRKFEDSIRIPIEDIEDGIEAGSSKTRFASQSKTLKMELRRTSIRRVRLLDSERATRTLSSRSIRRSSSTQWTRTS